MKKLLCTFLALVMVCATPVYITAEGEPTGKLVCAEPVKYETTEVKKLEEYVDLDVLKATIAPQFENYQTSIDISSLGIPFTSEFMSAVKNFLCEEMPEYFYVNPGYFWGYTDSIMTSFDVENICTPETYDEYKAKWDKETDRLLEGIRGNDSLTDVQKALLIHDRLAVHCEYDEERLDNGSVPSESYMAYGAIVNRISVCEGYSEAYTYLLGLVGIDSYICGSTQMRHQWNIVVIDGNNYYVDVTWDDPTTDISGRVAHNNFLLSYSAFASGHYGRDYDTSPVDTTYDDYFWKKSNSAFCEVGGEIYYIDSQAKTINTYDGTVVESIPQYWMAGPGSAWSGSFARTATDGENLLVSLPDSIYKYDVKNKTFEKLITPYQTFGEYFSIFGMTYEDGIYTCEYSTTPNFDKNTKKNYTIAFELNIPKIVEVAGEVTYYDPSVPAAVELKVDGEMIYYVETEIVEDGYKTTQQFKFDDVADGTYDLVITKPGHLPYTITGIIVAGESINLTTNSNPAIANIVLVAGDTNNDALVDLKDVIAITSEGTYNKTAETAECVEADINGDGLYDLQDLIIITSENNYNKGAVTVEY